MSHDPEVIVIEYDDDEFSSSSKRPRLDRSDVTDSRERLHGHSQDRKRPDHPYPRNTNSKDPRLVKSRVFVGNLPTDKISEDEFKNRFKKYGKILAVSVLSKYGFVQFEREKDARAAVAEEASGYFKGNKLEVNIACEGRKGHRPKEQGASRSRHQNTHSGPQAITYDEILHRGIDTDQIYHNLSNMTRELDSRGPGSRQQQKAPIKPLMEMRPVSPVRPALLPRPDSPVRQGLLPRPLSPVDWSRPRRPSPVRGMSVERSKPAFDCEIILTSHYVRSYAEAVEQQLQSMCNMFVKKSFFKMEQEVLKALEDLINMGVPYAIIISEQNEAHHSLTINILHGKTQEHRNMPVDDALNLIKHDFMNWMRGQREQTPPKPQSPSSSSMDSEPALSPVPAPAPAPVPPPHTLIQPLSDKIRYLVKLLGDDEPLSLEEIDDLLSYLERRRRNVVDSMVLQSTAGTAAAAAAAAAAVHEPNPPERIERAKRLKRAERHELAEQRDRAEQLKRAEALMLGQHARAERRNYDSMPSRGSSASSREDRSGSGLLGDYRPPRRY